MRISLKVAIDFTMFENGPACNCDIQAEVDGDGPDMIALEKMSGEHQRQMARYVHEFMQQIVAGLNGRPDDQPSWEHLRERISRLERTVGSHGEADIAEQIGSLASGLRLFEGRLPPIGWTTPSLVSESKGLTLSRMVGNNGTVKWKIHDYDGFVRAEGATPHGAVADLGE